MRNVQKSPRLQVSGMIQNRFTITFFLLAILVTGSLSFVFAQNNTPDAHIKRFNGVVNGMAYNPSNNLIYVGGRFTAYDPVQTNAGVFNTSTGVLNTSYPIASNTIRAIVSDGNGGWFIGGDFTQFGGQSRLRLAHVDASGQVTSWNPGTDGSVYALAYLNGIVYVGGIFSTAAGQNRSNLAAISGTTGTLQSWNPGPDGAVYSLLASGSLVYVGGNFNNIGGQARNRLASVSTSTGSASAFNPNANLAVLSLALDGSTLYAGGHFTSIGGQTRNRIAALSTSTGTATTWNPGASSTVYALALNGGNVYAGGNFLSLGGAGRNYIGAVSASTGIATSWNPGASGQVNCLLVNVNRLYVGGDFTAIAGQNQAGLVSFSLTTGDLNTWEPIISPMLSLGTGIKAFALSGTNLYAGGNPPNMGGTVRKSLAAVNSVTGVLSTWNPGSNGEVKVVRYRPANQTIYVGGTFTVLGAQTRNRIGALDLAGSVTAFDPNADNHVLDMDVTSGSVYVCGNFTNIGGLNRNHIARIDASTSTALSFNPNADGLVRAILRDPATGRIYAGGTFTEIGGQARSNLAELNLSTGAATTWNPPTINQTVSSLEQSATSVYIGGYFTQIGGQSNSHLRAINKTTGALENWAPVMGNVITSMTISGDTLYVGGLNSTLRRYFVSTGAQITGWTPSVGAFGGVDALTIAANAIVAGGSFSGGTVSHFAQWTFTCPAPNQPGSITGTNTPCQGASQTYSVAAVSGATSYTWTLPSGWTGSSTTNSITTTVGANSGNVSVTANSSCGSSNPRTLVVTVSNTPGQPGTITGPTGPCQGTLQNYSVTPVAGATSYTWTLPAGWSGTSTAEYIGAVVGPSSGTISVTANNICGSSPVRTLAVNSITPPAQPSSISGLFNLCEGDTANGIVSTVPGATSYSWLIPTGWSILSGQGTSSAILVAGASGAVGVYASNSCGNGQAHYQNVTVNPVPQVTASSNSPVASGGTIQLTGTSALATSWYWYRPNGTLLASTQNASIPNANSSHSGVYRLVVATNAGCTAEATVNVTVTSGATCNTVTDHWTSRITPTTARFNWNPVAGAAGYHIRGKAVSSPNWVYITVSGGSTSFVNVSGLFNNATLEWQIRTLCNAGADSSAWSASDVFTTGCMAPDTLWTAPIIHNAATFNWTRQWGTYGYEIRGRVYGFTGGTNLLVGGGATESKNVFGLNPNTTYEWRIRSLCNPSGTFAGPWTAWTIFTTASGPRMSGTKDPFAEEEEHLLLVAPNPMDSYAMLTFSNPDNTPFVLRLTDLNGRTVRQIEGVNGTQYRLEKEGLSSGLYILELLGDIHYRTKLSVH